MRKNSNIICDSYLNLTDASSHYQDNWICDETWFRLFNRNTSMRVRVGTKNSHPVGFLQ
jgi:hypothetical protein